jgi:hypothetical protein
MGKDARLIDLPQVEIRESDFNLDEIIIKISALKHRTSSEAEAILCLAHEIKKIKAILECDDC